MPQSTVFCWCRVSSCQAWGGGGGKVGGESWLITRRGLPTTGMVMTHSDPASPVSFFPLGHRTRRTAGYHAMPYCKQAHFTASVCQPLCIHYACYVELRVIIVYAVAGLRYSAFDLCCAHKSSGRRRSWHSDGVFGSAQSTWRRSKRASRRRPRPPSFSVRILTNSVGGILLFLVMHPPRSSVLWWLWWCQ